MGRLWSAGELERAQFLSRPGKKGLVAGMWLEEVRRWILGTVDTNLSLNHSLWRLQGTCGASWSLTKQTPHWDCPVEWLKKAWAPNLRVHTEFGNRNLIFSASSGILCCPCSNIKSPSWIVVPRHPWGRTGRSLELVSAHTNRYVVGEY